MKNIIDGYHYIYNNSEVYIVCYPFMALILKNQVMALILKNQVWISPENINQLNIAL